MKKILSILLIFMMISSCEQAESSNASSADVSSSKNLQEAIHQKKKSNSKDKNDNTDTKEKIERKIVKSGSIGFKTADISKTHTLISNLVIDLDGYVSNDKAENNDKNIKEQMVVRIPAQHFNLLLNKIVKDAGKLDYKRINAKDVTKKYINIKVRIESKIELQKKYEELLVKATKIKDILEIQKKISELQTEIETAKGQMRYLKNKINYSTLTINFYQKTTTSFGFGEKFMTAVKKGWSLLLWVIIGLTNIWGLILILVIIYFIIIVYRKKKGEKNKGRMKVKDKGE